MVNNTTDFSAYRLATLHSKRIQNKSFMLHIKGLNINIQSSNIYLTAIHHFQPLKAIQGTGIEYDIYVEIPTVFPYGSNPQVSDSCYKHRSEG